MARRSRANQGKRQEAESNSTQRWRQLELALNLEVEESLLEPEAANLSQLVQRFDTMLAALPEPELLRYGGTYLDRLSALYHQRAMALLDDWEEEYNSEGPRFDDTLLAGLVREHHSVDLSGFVKPAHRAHSPKPTGPIDDEDSVFLELDTEQAVLLAQQELEQPTNFDHSHAEDIQAWSAVVQQYLEQEFKQAEQNFKPVRLVDLHRSLCLSWVELLLALLLGGYFLDQRGHFYQLETIWVTPHE